MDRKEPEKIGHRRVQLRRDTALEFVDVWAPVIGGGEEIVDDVQWETTSLFVWMAASNSPGGDVGGWLEAAMTSGVVGDLATLCFWTKPRRQWTRKSERGRDKPIGNAGIYHRVGTDEFSAADSTDSSEKLRWFGGGLSNREWERIERGTGGSERENAEGVSRKGEVGVVPSRSAVSREEERRGRLEVEEKTDRRARDGSEKKRKAAGWGVSGWKPGPLPRAGPVRFVSPFFCSADFLYLLFPFLCSLER
jgi:hypothetical protein